MDAPAHDEKGRTLVLGHPVAELASTKKVLFNLPGD